MFAVTNACREKEWLPTCTIGDSLTLAADGLIVAALVTLVCLAVIGKVAVAGPVGTVNNPWIQAMIGVSAGLFAADLVAAVVKWKAGKPQENTLKSSSEGTSYQSQSDIQKDPASKADEVVKKLRSKIASNPKYQQLTGLFFDVAPQRFVQLHAASKGQVISSVQCRNTSDEQAIEKIAAIPEGEIEGMAAGIPSEEIWCYCKKENLAVILKEWFGMAQFQEPTLKAALTWCYKQHQGQVPNPEQLTSYEARSSVNRLEAMALYLIYKKSMLHPNELRKIEQYLQPHQADQAVGFKDRIKARLAKIANYLDWTVNDPNAMELD